MTLQTIFWTTLGFAFALGAVVGSFLNVVIYRVPAGKSVVFPSSHCPRCQSSIAWYDNIPILAWALWLGRKCRHCREPVAARYALVEALTGALAAALWYKVAWGAFQDLETLYALGPLPLLLPFGLYFVFLCLLVAITFIDLDHFIIPHGLTFPGMALGVGSAWILGHSDWLTPGALYGLWPPVTLGHSVVGLVAGALSVLGIYVLYYALRRAEGIGGGDVTLMAVMGAWLGWPSLVFIFFAASAQGVVAAGLSQLVGGGLARDAREILSEEPSPTAPATEMAGAPTHDPSAPEASEPQGEEEHPGGLAVPFGPFIALAGVEYFFFGPYLPDVISMSYLYGM